MIPRYFRVALLALTAGMLLASCDRDKDPEPPAQPPPTPDLFNVTSVGDNFVRLNWYSPTDQEHGFYLYMRQETTNWARRDTFPPSTAHNVYNMVQGLLPGSTYFFRVTAFNAAGESGPTTERSATTTGTLPPDPPANVHAEALSANNVRVAWTPTGSSAGFRIDRRMPTSAWNPVGTTGALDTVFVDSSANALTSYYYRVGATRGALVVWAADSALVTTPDGPPLAPDSVRSEILPGLGVRLTWIDRSTNEAGFHVARRVQGQFFEIIDSVAAGTPQYFDSLGNSAGDYEYRVRAYNAIGVSAWTLALPVGYELCSDGVVPLCLDNWWRYNVVDHNGPDYVIERSVRDLRLVDGQDYYLITEQVQPPVGQRDTLYYLRNGADGCRELDFPLPANPQSELLFRYPGLPGQWSMVDGDCVIVAGTNGTANIGGTLYTGLYVYQRFYSGSHSVQIYVKPQTIGIVLEQEYINSSLAFTRSIVSYFVQNN